MLDEARSSCSRVVIDTTGLVTGPVGRVYKQYKIDLLKPDLVVGLERVPGELGEILGPFAGLERPYVYTRPALKGAASKSAEHRSSFRREAFRRYFSEVSDIDLPLDKIGVVFSGEAAADLSGRLVSLRDERCRDMAVGYVVYHDAAKARAVVRAPVKKGLSFRQVVIGKASVEL